MVVPKAGIVIPSGSLTCRMADTVEPLPTLSDPRALLLGYLDHNQMAILRKLDGLSDREMRRSRVPSGWTPLGLVKHLACTERFWIRFVFAGEDVDFSWPGTAEQEWQVEPAETAAEIRAFFLAEREHARQVVVSSPLDRAAARETGPEGDRTRPTLAWVLFHLVESYARHAGHLDIVRELVDGVTGK